jgi:sigma-B regulation protein RsbU (phosphoserine phosphatase)
MAVLRIILGPNLGQLIKVENAKTVIGRHPSCDIALSDVGAVSRQHAQILREGDEYFVEDLDSRNGTYVNGTRIEVRQRHKLLENDELKICDVVFRFHHGEPPAESSWATMVEEEHQSGSSTVMTRIDVSSSSGLRVSVNAEAKLKALIEISKSLANSLAEDKVLSNILDSLFRVFPQADRGFIVLRGEDPKGPLVPKAVKYRRGGQDDTVRISKTVVNQVMESKQAILSADAAKDDRFKMSESIADFRIRSMMCVPLINSEGKAIGILQIDTLDQRSRFQEDDLDVLASVASQAAFAIENAQMHGQALWQESIKRDLDLARQVQKGFLPKHPPQIDGYQFFDFYEPASHVGGDFFDYVMLPGSRVAVIVADVSGKGVPAALLMAKVTSEARYHLVTQNQPGAAISHLANAFSDYGFSDRFVTFVMAVVDYKLHEITLVNAGHMAPFLRRADGCVEEIGAHITGVPLGVDPDWQYEEHRFVLRPGEIITAFTDGFSEAENEERELYGMDLLQKQVSGPAANATDLGQRILADVKRHVGGQKQSDDMCLICFGRT